MKDISCKIIIDTVEQMCIEANKFLPTDVKNKICYACENESNNLSRSVLFDIKKNYEVAEEYNIPICQDTGMAVIFLEIGQDVHIIDGYIYDAINEGVRRGYEKGLLRKSVVSDPLKRINSGDNTPAIIHTTIVEGDTVKITVAPKGFGSENMSGIKMLTPFDSREGVINAVLDIVKNASNNPCPPIIVGVGIGGDFEQCALLSKKALCRSTDIRHIDPFYEELENEILEKINALNIGVQGFGGNNTALAVNIETAPTHIAGLPVAVNIGCHVTRHITREVK